jgi:fatty acid desaturase
MVMQGKQEASANNERIWREQLGALVDADELSSLSEQSLPDTFLVMAVLWVEVIALLVAANFLTLLTLPWAIAGGIVIVLLMGLRMNAFGVIVHEGSHGFLAKSRRLNDRICNWAVAFWTINSVEEYRPTHRLHHRYLGQERDPDRVFYLVPRGRGALTSLVMQDLAGSPRSAGRPLDSRERRTSLEGRPSC